MLLLLLVLIPNIRGFRRRYRLLSPPSPSGLSLPTSFEEGWLEGLDEPWESLSSSSSIERSTTIQLQI